MSHIKNAIDQKAAMMQIVRFEEDMNCVIKSCQYKHKDRIRNLDVGLRYGENVIKRCRIRVPEDEEEKVTTAPKEVEDHVNHTFWEDDERDRQQLSQEEYEAFLSEHSLNLIQPEDYIAQLTTANAE